MDIDKAVRALRDREQEAHAAADEAVAAIRERVRLCLPSAAETYVRWRVRERHDVVRQLLPDRLEEAIRTVELVTAGLPARADQALTSLTWPHQAATHVPKRAHRILWPALAGLWRSVGDGLVRYGIEEDEPDGCGPWIREVPLTGGDGTAAHAPIPPDVATACAEYDARHSDWCRVSRELRRAVENAARAEAELLWGA